MNTKLIIEFASEEDAGYFVSEHDHDFNRPDTSKLFGVLLRANINPETKHTPSDLSAVIEFANESDFTTFYLYQDSCQKGKYIGFEHTHISEIIRRATLKPDITRADGEIAQLKDQIHVLNEANAGLSAELARVQFPQDLTESTWPGKTT